MMINQVPKTVTCKAVSVSITQMNVFLHLIAMPNNLVNPKEPSKNLYFSRHSIASVDWPTDQLLLGYSFRLLRFITSPLGITLTQQMFYATNLNSPILLLTTELSWKYRVWTRHSHMRKNLIHTNHNYS